jgi:hypothetical protein
VWGTENLPGSDLHDLYPDVIPKLSPEEISPCTFGQPGCTRAIFVEAIAKRRRIHLPNTTPSYSNSAFAMLGLVLESASGAPYADALRRLLVDPLGMKDTTASAPRNSSRGVIVGSETAVGWDLMLDDAWVGTGALFSTPNDMSVIGRAILSSSLLSPNTTRAWMKPTSHTSSLFGAVGRPWEIHRAVLGPAENNRVVDLYTKTGNLGGYGCKFVLVPDYNVGFVVMMAGQSSKTSNELSGIIVDQLLPALDEAARVEADSAFAGNYRAANGLNTTLRLSSIPGNPGLRIEELVSNGTDLVRYFFGSPQSFQMYPTNIMSEDGKRVSWRMNPISHVDRGPFSACSSWALLDRPTYGVYGRDEVEFYLGEDGKAVAAEPKPLKIVLQRQ